MRIAFAFILTFLIFTNANCEEKKVVEFPQEYFKDKKKQSESEETTTTQESKIGTKGDKFITKSEYDKKYSSIPKGNESKIVKCPCPSGNCQGNCHVKVIVNNKTGDKQYKYIPVQSENDAQTNPYFMMIARQRVMAKTESAESTVFKMPEQTKKDVKKEEQKPVVQQPVVKKPEKTRFYTSVVLGFSTGGKAHFVSKEETGGYSSTGGVTSTDGPITNFSLDRGYGTSPYMSVAFGVERKLLLSAVRFDISSSFRMLYTESMTNVVQTRTANGTNVASFTIDSKYGNGGLYTLEGNVSLDILKQVTPVYFSVGAGGGLGYFSFQQPSAEGAVFPVFSLFAHLNFDLDSGNTFFIGPKITMSPGGSMTNNQTDRDSNSANTNLYDSRLVYSRTVEISDFSIYGIEAGMRFY